MSKTTEFKATNKTQQVYDYLTELIQSNELQPGDQMLPESKLAKKLGVGVVTVRRAMSMLVESGMVHRIQGMGTIVAEAKPDDKSPLPLIATVYPFGPAETNFKNTLTGIQLGANANNYNSLIHFGTRKDMACEEAETLDNLLSQGIKGFIIYPVADEQSHDNILRLDRENIPYVLLDKYFDDIESNYVGIDVTSGALDVIDALRQHHERIGFISPGLHFSSNRDRLMGYQNALKQRNLPSNQQWIWVSKDRTVLNVDEGYIGTQTILKTKKPPTAIVAGNHHIAVGASKALSECGLSSDDVCIVSYDDFSEFGPQFPHLDWPREEIGQQAANLLCKYIKNNQRKKEQILLKPTFKPLPFIHQ